MHCLGKVFLFFLFLAGSLVVPPISESNECFGLAWGADFKSYGTNGQDGKAGESGQNGSNSDNLTIFADGSPLTLNLAGREGGNGDNGGDGQKADCGSQPVDVRYNLQAASGGNGSNGGNGGDGGNGGSLTIYTTNLANLKQIYVDAAGGKGGQAGQAGKAGQGCNCTKPYWTLEICTGKPGDADYRCTTQEFSCQNSRNGVAGVGGVAGRDGFSGKLTLVSLNKPLEDDRPAATVAMSQLREQGYILSKNFWETRQGATAMFAQGSVIDDQYLALVKREERSFLLIWNAPQSFNKFADRQVTLNLQDASGINAVLPQDIWIETATQQHDNITELVVYNAILETEATQLESEGLLENGTNLQLKLVDKANLSNLIASQFKITYRITRSDPRFRPVSDYITQFEGEVPAELIKLNGNQFTIDIGKLPIEPQHLRPGLGVEINLKIARSFAGYSAEQRIVIQDIIGPFR